MRNERSKSLSHLVFRDHAGGIAVVGSLMMLSAATEGLGLVLLVPMLGALQPGSSPGGGLISKVIADLGISAALGPMLLLFVVLIVARAVVGHFTRLASLILRSQIVDGLRLRAWAALLHCDWRVLSNMRQSRNASKLLGVVERVGDGVDHALVAVAVAVTLAGISVAAMAISPRMTASAMTGGALVLLVYRGMRRRAGQLGEQMGEAYERFSGQLQEGLGALRVIKSFGRESKAEDRVRTQLAQLRRAETRFQRGVGLGQIALQSAGALVLASAVWLATTRWHASPVAILPVIAMFARALPLLGSLQENWQHWAHARPALSTTLDLIREAEAAREPDAPTELPPLSLPLVLEQVSVFRAARARPILNAVSLSIPSAGIVALTGHSGAGKSTLADLMGGLIGPDEGVVSAGGVQLEEGLRRAWRSHVAYVQQEPILFAGSIRDNLLWADPSASNDQLWQAIDDASAGFIRELPGGLDAQVGEGGRQLSGGERQRIALARGLLRKPALLILDEATSAIDARNEAEIVTALQRLKAKLAIVVISHRGALLRIADEVVAVDSGCLVQSGRSNVGLGSRAGSRAGSQPA